MKQFFKVFAIAFIVFLLISLPVRTLLTRVGELTILGPTEINLMADMEPIAVQDSVLSYLYEDSQRVNVLLLGVNGGLTDTIMLVSFDMKEKHVDLISIPRDTYFYRKGYGTDAEKKINAAYRNSALNTAQAVNELLLGMPIHYYAVLSYDGVANIVDSIGGVPMYIEKAMKYSDPKDKPPLVINIPAGEQVLDGENSVKFLRYRKGYTEGDIGRVKAQQEFMKSAFKQMLKSDLLEVAGVVKENVESDMTLSMSLKIATVAIGLDSESMETHVMPHTLEPNPPYYVYPDTKGITDMIIGIYSYEGDHSADGDDPGAAAEGNRSGKMSVRNTVYAWNKHSHPTRALYDPDGGVDGEKEGDEEGLAETEQ